MVTALFDRVGILQLEDERNKSRICILPNTSKCLFLGPRGPLRTPLVSVVARSPLSATKIPDSKLTQPLISFPSDSKLKQPLPPVSYTHLTLPTKA